MKNTIRLAGICAAWLAVTTMGQAQVPRMISYQGHARTAAGVPFTGMGHFKFALVDAGAAFTYWSNDGATGAGAFPAVEVLVPVNNGVYSVYLGNTALAGMTASIPPGVFANSAVYLRVWFSDGTTAPALLSPDIRIVSVGYAMIAATVVDDAITTAKLVDKAVTAEKLDDNAITTSSVADDAITAAKLADDAVTTETLADGAVTSAKLAEEITLGSALSADGGVLRLLPGFLRGTAATISLDGGAGSVNASSALVLSKTQPALFPGGPSITETQAILSAESSGGRLSLFDESQSETAALGARSAGGGELTVFQEDGTTGAYVLGDRFGDNSGGAIGVSNGEGDWRVYIYGDLGGAGQISVRNADGTKSITIDGQASDGFGRITTPVLEITGGSDLSENFDIASEAAPAMPGMVVCIDPNRPGQLVVSSKAYDRTVAGIMSGAGGVKPGMLMGQHGTAASGKHAVALTGRVYCQADASNGSIQPGDLLTTSDIPGHAMKATDPARTSGAIIGKAMTPLPGGQGLVLVLVTLQ
jgi:hypothetical protein